jgi:hypothetical protein
MNDNNQEEIESDVEYESDNENKFTKKKVMRTLGKRTYKKPNTRKVKTQNSKYLKFLIPN